MSDKPWAVVQHFGALGARIKSTHRTRWLALMAAAWSVMPAAAVHPTDHARVLVAQANATTFAVLDGDGGTRHVTEYEDPSAAEVALRFGVSDLTIRRGIKAGALRTYDLDGKRYVVREDAEALASEVRRLGGRA